jgi:hypothetical protein
MITYDHNGQLKTCAAAAAGRIRTASSQSCAHPLEGGYPDPAIAGIGSRAALEETGAKAKGHES